MPFDWVLKDTVTINLAQLEGRGDYIQRIEKKVQWMDLTSFFKNCHLNEYTLNLLSFLENVDESNVINKIFFSKIDKIFIKDLEKIK